MPLKTNKENHPRLFRNLFAKQHRFKKTKNNNNENLVNLCDDKSTKDHSKLIYCMKMLIQCCSVETEYVEEEKKPLSQLCSADNLILICIIE